MLVDDLLRGAGLRDHVKVICSGKVGVYLRLRPSPRARLETRFSTYVVFSRVFSRVRVVGGPTRENSNTSWPDPTRLDPRIF